MLPAALLPSPAVRLIAPAPVPLRCHAQIQQPSTAAARDLVLRGAAPRREARPGRRRDVG
jgi:hypothetical protein